MTGLVFLLFLGLIAIGVISFIILSKAYNGASIKFWVEKLENSDVSIDEALTEKNLKIVNKWDGEFITNAKL